MTARTIPAVLSIAGSDSGGGAGIQADLKAFAACGVHGMTAITALTAQNTIAVDAVVAVAPEMIVAQVRAVARDIGVDAVKIGMLGTVATIDAVVAALDELPPATPIVLDPVMVSESGSQLLQDDARDALVTKLLPRVTVTTPNVPEARVIAAGIARAGAGGTGSASARGAEGAGGAGEAESGAADLTRADAPELARAIHALGPTIVVVTGGHREQATDVLFDGRTLVEIPGARFPDGAAHGSGCTHSSALAAHLALGYEPVAAARAAKAVAARAVRDGLREIGRGAGPVDALGIRDNQPRR
ncbi:hydroxymethylpyrimidine/phosphomethylpyrimidine kinase [Conexibacter sp. JD483]|uniref:bifunctional hydroxymethylpyrimidine kinase/phosphomethylpyrimidine kinase n=1 Tax=unclassified Conexibacter TaxID=2627773 RepID=UPI0027211ACB|nr:MULTISPECIES: hydroxymethylpyrimidine/phosphomethylpyrimidine kinase [unclassified Conexibacter]MDO8184517.1 hydroxymethylpyrimidine/phosphomethylpyrimidine kinase [Conexibacter sp. CPCC 205706]MDO8197823.1 hydroxymethylpyrimidine/phosphomethylpyrimidine kinase [Conexibacter sp. CPCC 205762]MDR9369229.1 hydroxymethylpyrimidine/phosphomethylpyrimidine kinase [Conexibacter sp. JD483]